MQIRSAFPCALALALSPLFGCSTILNGSRQTIHVETDPPGATATVLGERHTTPFDLVLSRRAEGAEVLIEKPGFVPKTIPLRRRTTGSTWFNFLGMPLGAAAGGAIAASQSSSSDMGTGFENAATGTVAGAVIATGAAFIVDAASGAIHRFDPPAIAVRLEPAPAPPAAPASTP